nr:nuclear transcription factor Y subunit B-1-like [Setaria viridis]
MDNQPKNHQDGATEAPEERKIPRATVARIMRKATPPNSKIGADAKEAVDQCLVEFAAFITQVAAEECRRDKRTTVTGDDLILAFKNLGFDDYVGPLTLYLHRYREIEGNMPRARHSTMRSQGAPPAPAALTVEAAAAPSSGLTLQLGPPSVPDVTELGLHADVYAVWRGAAAPAAAGTSQAPSGADEE